MYKPYYSYSLVIATWSNGPLAFMLSLPASVDFQCRQTPKYPHRPLVYRVSLTYITPDRTPVDVFNYGCTTCGKHTLWHFSTTLRSPNPVELVPNTGLTCRDFGDNSRQFYLDLLLYGDISHYHQRIPGCSPCTERMRRGRKIDVFKKIYPKDFQVDYQDVLDSGHLILATGIVRTEEVSFTLVL
ncbi:hypothetical protein K435DRAFT_805352 [Dendrothele bispora CBS 962.96]|uniref:Uncharacterized protein n=1 Tax=Dendrothele bispora (strain CBS 962.96) TaxID=1314807 RepID=A0A4S8LB86_DENBC|nr:hypothetical protein K435DRAFT_805352 [Dendrothele bispora CBS 962.96]